VFDIFTIATLCTSIEQSTSIHILMFYTNNMSHITKCIMHNWLLRSWIHSRIRPLASLRLFHIFRSEQRDTLRSLQRCRHDPDCSAPVDISLKLHVHPLILNPWQLYSSTTRLYVFSCLNFSQFPEFQNYLCSSCISAILLIRDLFCETAYIQLRIFSFHFRCTHFSFTFVISSPCLVGACILRWYN
jgi:hypothetical protein